ATTLSRKLHIDPIQGLKEARARADRLRPQRAVTYEVRLLGPVEARSADRELEMGSPQQRAVLAALAVGAGRSVALGTLVDRVWGEAPPCGPGRRCTPISLGSGVFWRRPGAGWFGGRRGTCWRSRPIWWICTGSVG